jgi:hypothetical protein
MKNLCVLCITMVESFRGLRKCSGADPLLETLMTQHQGFTLVCHSEECSDEESAFDFPFLVQRIGKSAKQMLHFIQHDTILAPFAPLRESHFWLRLCRFYSALMLPSFMTRPHLTVSAAMYWPNSAGPNLSTSAP